MKQLGCLLPALVILSLASARTSPAALISVDLNLPGDGLATRDTASGLEWLDLSESTGYSYGEIESGAGGFLALGFRHANQTEVFSLMLSFGFPDPLEDPAYLDASHFLNLVSCTSTCTVDGRGSNGIADQAPFNSDSKIVLNLFVFVDPIPPHASLTQFDVTAEHSGPTIGHYLVRTVPEPHVLVLTFLALLPLGLGIPVRSRKSPELLLPVAEVAGRGSRVDDL